MSKRLGYLLIVAAVVMLSSGWVAEAEYISRDGVLTATLEAAPQTLRFDTVSIEGKTYNGDYAGPVMRVHPGDLMRIRLVNHLSEPTNLHFHGLHSSPQGHGDNVHIVVPPGQSFDYEVAIPAAQPPGLYWYHAHIHGISEAGIMAGLSGTIVVEDPAPQPELAGIAERLFVLKDHTLEQGASGTFRDLVQTINGATTTTLAMRPGETQLWRFSNQSADRYFHLSLAGHGFRLINIDGVATTKAIVVDTLDIAPAARMDALVEAGAAGSYDLVSQKVLTGSGAERALTRRLGVLGVSGAAMPRRAPIDPSPKAEDLRSRPIDASRTIVLSQLNDGEHFLIDGRTFDPHRIDLRVPLGNVEEWTIRDVSNDTHIFHIHQVHFQVTEINGEKQPFGGVVDGVKVPEAGEVKIRLAFTDPAIVGTFMYHCHILEHEDKGMMAHIEVYDPAKEPGLLDRLWQFLGLRHAESDPLDVCRAKSDG